MTDLSISSSRNSLWSSRHNRLQQSQDVGGYRLHDIRRNDRRDLRSQCRRNQCWHLFENSCWNRHRGNRGSRCYWNCGSRHDNWHYSWYAWQQARWKTCQDTRQKSIKRVCAGKNGWESSSNVWKTGREKTAGKEAGRENSFKRISGGKLESGGEAGQRVWDDFVNRSSRENSRRQIRQRLSQEACEWIDGRYGR